MPVLWLFVLLLVIAAVAFFAGRATVLRTVKGKSRLLHSLPGFYGWYTSILTFVPAFLVLIVWVIVQPLIINHAVAPMITSAQDDIQRSLMADDVQNIAKGLDLMSAQGLLPQETSAMPDDLRGMLGSVGVALGSDPTEDKYAAALEFRALSRIGSIALTAVVLMVAGAGFLIARRQVTPTMMARNKVEDFVRSLLILSASIAILTTVGIVLSLVFSTIKFFGLYPAADFFFGLTWSPSFQGESELGLLPLIWGTLFISLIALLVAVPIGLFAAVYLSEYASSSMRAIAKPALEVLAGIPTIVYGLFALLTVGPLLRTLFGDGGTFGVNWMTSADAAITAGLVMGMMLIPFVSSLSDDIINAVPQAMRDGSLGLGATPSETIRQVVLPAALPGIVGAILLAASRAIGETMIVVLGAGAAAQISMNPFDAMTTVTTRIVAQLTGDLDFSSPTALVAFALGMTLFVITLGLNVLALFIVRKYQEQYE